MTHQPTFTRADPDDRRQSLIEATARILARKGAAGASVRAICAEAGVSPGLLRHYFAGVAEAIAETYRWIGRQIDDALARAVDSAGIDPRARLVAYLSASFRPPIASGELLASYVALWSMTRANPAIAAIRAEVYGNYRHGLERLLRAYRPQMPDPGMTAIILTALIDGLWLELSLGNAPLDESEAQAIIESKLDNFLA